MEEMPLTDYERLRLEYNRESFRKELAEKIDNRCANCGKKCKVQYHHIVPLALRGTNRITNIVGLCPTCHKLAHGSKNIREIFRPEKTGRPKRKAPDGYENILNRYVYGEIGRKECESLLKLSKATKLNDVWYYKEYLKAKGIVKHKNKIDLLMNKNNCVPKGREIAIIIFENGEEVIKYA